MATNRWRYLGDRRVQVAVNKTDGSKSVNATNTGCVPRPRGECATDCVPCSRLASVTFSLPLGYLPAQRPDCSKHSC